LSSQRDCPTVRILILTTALLFGSSAPAMSDDTFTAWPRVLEAAKATTVLIRVEIADQPISYGSGVIVSRQGLILTARHVLPEQTIRASGSYLISSLIGWDRPTLDFSGAHRLEIEYVSDRYDVAILRFRSPPADLKYALIDDKLTQGQPVLVLGYPSGGNLAVTAGVASKEAEGGRYATDAAVGPGNSGGPVFAPSGRVLGIITEGTRPNSPQIRLGYFVTGSTVLKELSSERPALPLGGPEPSRTRFLPAAVTLSYAVDDGKEDHPSYLPHEADYERSFLAQDGYRIVSAAFSSASANNVTKGPHVVVAPDGSAVSLKFTLRSGPFFDRWRGWLAGGVVTTQERK